MALAYLLAFATVLAAAAGSPVVQPPAPSLAAEAIPRPAPTSGCTTTTVYDIPFEESCTMDGVSTVFPSTTVVTSELDCHGCDELDVRTKFYYCPFERFTSVTTASVPSTSLRFKCQTSTNGQPTVTRVRAPPSPRVTGSALDDSRRTPEHYAGVAELRAVAPVSGVEVCVTTFVIQPSKSSGPTSTIFKAWSTIRVSLACGGCSLTLSTALAGLGPPAPATKTVTASLGVVTAYQCQ